MPCVAAGGCSGSAVRFETPTDPDQRLAAARRPGEVVDVSAFVDTASQHGSTLGEVDFHGTDTLGSPARSDHQLATDQLVDRLNDYTAATSIAHLHAIAADVLRAWEHSFAAGDPVSVSRLIALTHAIRAASKDHGTGIIG